jgi:hypothetical protein
LSRGLFGLQRVAVMLQLIAKTRTIGYAVSHWPQQACPDVDMEKQCR